MDAPARVRSGGVCGVVGWSRLSGGEGVAGGVVG